MRRNSSLINKTAVGNTILYFLPNLKPMPIVNSKGSPKLYEYDALPVLVELLVANVE